RNHAGHITGHDGDIPLGGKIEMPGCPPPASREDRQRQISAALRLSWISVLFGLLAGAVSVATGVTDRSLGVLAVGLGVLADVTGSATLIWRFRAERRRPELSHAAESAAALTVAVALAVVSAVIIVPAAVALAARSRPGASDVTLIAAGISIAVLTPLAYAKRRLGGQMASRALRGDGTLSGIGAAESLLALTALVLYHALGWWWADRVSALTLA